MGVISEIVPCFSRKRVFGYEFVALASIAIAVLGFLVWAHHMFVAGISVYAALVFSLLTLPGGDSFGGENLQLDGHAVQGIDHL